MLAPTAPFAEQVQRCRDDLRSLIRDHLTAYAARRPVRTVCVVANAPLLPRVDRATEIDAADLVIRINSMTLDEVDGQPCIGRVCHVVLLSMATVVTPWVLQDYRRRAYLVPQAGWDVHSTECAADRPSADSPILAGGPGRHAAAERLGEGTSAPAARRRPAPRVAAADERPDGALPRPRAVRGCGADRHRVLVSGQREPAVVGAPFRQPHPGHRHHDLGLEAQLLRSWIDDSTLRLLS